MSTATLSVWGREENSPKKDGAAWPTSSSPEDVALTDALDVAAKMIGEDQGEDGEPTILSAAFDRAEEFLRLQSEQMRRRYNCWLTPPSISPGPKGSVDLSWKQSGCGLLINIPPNDARATYYGERQNQGSVKGTFDPKVWNLVILTWLSKQ
jgi:hypothetical protein